MAESLRVFYYKLWYKGYIYTLVYLDLGYLDPVTTDLCSHTGGVCLDWLLHRLIQGIEPQATRPQSGKRWGYVLLRMVQPRNHTNDTMLNKHNYY